MYGSHGEYVWSIMICITQSSDEWTIQYLIQQSTTITGMHTSMASCQKSPTRYAYAWQIGPFWQDTLDIYLFSRHRWTRRFAIWLYSPDVLPLSSCRSTRCHSAMKPLMASVSYPQTYGLAKSHDMEWMDPAKWHGILLMVFGVVCSHSTVTRC